MSHATSQRTRRDLPLLGNTDPAIARLWTCPARPHDHPGRLRLPEAASRVGLANGHHADLPAQTQRFPSQSRLPRVGRRSRFRHRAALPSDRGTCSRHTRGTGRARRTHREPTAGSFPTAVGDVGHRGTCRRTDRRHVEDPSQRCRRCHRREHPGSAVQSRTGFTGARGSHSTGCGRRGNAGHRDRRTHGRHRPARKNCPSGPGRNRHAPEVGDACAKG